MQNHSQNNASFGYPFGMLLPERTWTSDSASYRHGFNTQERDDEIYGEGNSTTAEYWQYDSRLGRRWNTDPVEIPSVSSYSVLYNNPIIFVDPYGNTPSLLDAMASSNESSPKLKFVWQIARLNPWWWGKGGRNRMLEFLRCRAFSNPFKMSKKPFTWIRVVNKTQVRTRTKRIRVRERNGQPSDQVINTSSGGQIVIIFFNDFSQVDQLIIEDATGGNGVGSDPSNNNTANDLFASPVGPDGPNTSPPINNINVPVNSNETRIRVIPNVNGGNNTTSIYNARVVYQYAEKRTKHREYFLGFIPFFWKNTTSKWTATDLNTQPSKTVIRR